MGKLKRVTPPTYLGRLGREIPTDARGVPVCPRCHQSKHVWVSKWNEPYCRFCRRSIRWVEPRPAPDF